MKTKKQKVTIIVVLSIMFLVVLAIVIPSVIGNMNPRAEYEYKLKEDGTYAITKGSFFNGIKKLKTLEYPSEYNGKKITEINLGYSDHTVDTIETIVVPEGVEVVAGIIPLPKNADLKKYKLPSTLKEISVESFPNNRDVELDFTSNDTYTYENKCIIEKETNTLIIAFKGYDFSNFSTIAAIGKNACCNIDLPTDEIIIGENIKSVDEYVFSPYANSRVTINTLRLATTGKMAAHSFSNCYVKKLIVDSIPNSGRGGVMVLSSIGNDGTQIYVNSAIDETVYLYKYGDYDYELESDMVGYRKFTRIKSISVEYV